MIEIKSTIWKSWREEPDSVERIVADLKKHVLDPRFEGFIDGMPKWIYKEDEEKYKGCVVICGNFWEYSGVFHLITDEAEIVKRIGEAIAENMARPEFKAAKKEWEEEVRKNRARFMKRVS